MDILDTLVSWAASKVVQVLPILLKKEKVSRRHVDVGVDVEAVARMFT